MVTPLTTGQQYANLTLPSGFQTFALSPLQKEPIMTLVPSATKLPDEPDDLKPNQFRIDKRTYANGQLSYVGRRFFVGDLRVFFGGYRHAGRGKNDRRVAIFSTVEHETIGLRTTVACDGAELKAGKKPVPLLLGLDEKNLKFAVAR
jgi:hypothetical protein